MKKSYRRLAIVAAWLASSAAQAVEIAGSTAEWITVRNCIVGATACDFISGLVFEQRGGLAGDRASAANIGIAGYGSASGVVALSGVIGAPLLGASAISETGRRLNTNSAALQRYVYEGLVPTTRTFGGALTYSQLSTGPLPEEVSFGVYGELELFTLPMSTISIGPTREENIAMLFGGYRDLASYQTLGSAFFSAGNTSANGTENLSVAVALNPGDTVWALALLQTPAVNGGRVDTATFMTAWDDPTGLVPATIAVPEPSASALLLVGGLALFGVAWRRRRFGTSERFASVGAPMPCHAGSGPVPFDPEQVSRKRLRCIRHANA